MISTMYTINATDLKNRLGEALTRARLEPVAISRHGNVIAHLTAVPEAPAPRVREMPTSEGLSRRDEARLVKLCASGDFRPSRWLRAGNRRLLGGVATMLASHPEFDRIRLLALAERLSPGITRPEAFTRWLEHAPVRAARLLPMVRAELRHARP
jgi:antitoxin (DNA-binding transcriptional repressor) of toxin-antitoxin stability system